MTQKPEGNTVTRNYQSIGKRRKIMRKVAIIVAMALVLCGAFAMSAQATPALSLQDYIDLGSNGVQIDDKLFFDFFYVGSASNNAVAIPASGISVTPLNDPYNPGILFNAAWSVGVGQTLDSYIQYSVKVLPGGNAIKDISASMQGFGADLGGVVSVAETTPFGNLFLYSNGSTLSYAEVTFNPTMGPFTVVKDISVNGNNGFAAVSGVTNRFSEVPVPPSLLLLGSGLLGLVGLRFRRKLS